MVEKTKLVKEYPPAVPPQRNPLGDDEPASEVVRDNTHADVFIQTRNFGGDIHLYEQLGGPVTFSHFMRALETKPVKDRAERPEETNPPPDDHLGSDMPPDEPSFGNSSEGMNHGGEADDDDDESASEAIPNDTDADHSAETKNTGGDMPLNKLLLRLVRGDEDLGSEAGLDKLDRMLAGGAQVNAKDADGETALHLAASNGLVEAATMLIGAGAKVSETDNEERQPLHKACSGGYVEVVNLLVKNGASTQIIEEDGWSPLHMASRYGHAQVIRALLAEDKKNIDATERLEGWTALHVAIYNGQSDAVSVLLEEGANVGIRDNDGWTPLMTAIKRQHEDIVVDLLEQNRDLEQEARRKSLELETRNESGHTPLLAASVNGFSAGVSLLIKAGADCTIRSSRSKSTALIAATCWGHTEIVRVLLEASGLTIVNIQDEDKRAALHYASNRGHSEVVELLLQHQHLANVNLVDDHGQTALHLASQKGNENVAKLLLDAKANVDAQDEEDETALHLASGARPNEPIEQDNDELGPDDLSPDERGGIRFSSGQHASVVELLLKHNAKPDTKTKKGETALHLAAARGDSTRLELILASMDQKHMSTKDEQGRTALYLACTGDNPESAVESLLRSDKLRTAEFGRTDVTDAEIKRAENYPNIHEVAKGLMKQRLKRKRIAQPAGSDKWSSIEWAAYSQLPDILSLLIKKSPPPPELQAALKFVLDVTLASALGTRVNQGLGNRQLLQVLSLLIETFSGTPEIKAKLKSTLELVKRAENQEQGLELTSILPKSSKDEAPTSSHKAKKKDAQKKDPDRTVPTTQTTEDSGDDYLHALVDILRDPPFSQTHKDSIIDGPPEPNDKLSKILTNHEATIVQFYKDDGESGTFRRYRSLKEVIYGEGPEEIMKRTISDFIKIFKGLPDSLKHLQAEPQFTWVHLPATNMVWMNDIFMNIMSHEKDGHQNYHELKSFFRNSWTQVPDRTSSSRSMRPRTVVRRQENESGGQHDNTKKGEEGESDKRKQGPKKEEEDDRGEESGKVKGEIESEEGRRAKRKPDFGAASATYMPYFCFSTYYQDGATLGKKQKKFIEMKEAYEGLNDSKSSVVHGSPTLDEWYYQFATDDKSTEDRDRRNESQVVTKAMKGSESTKEGDESTKEGRKDQPGKLTLIRVNQLWAWTIADKWLITATPCLFDDSNGTLVEGILEQLGKEVEAGGSASQPESASAMSRFVVDYCITTYERLPKPQQPKPQEPKSQESKPQVQASIRQIFSNTINQIGRDEASLFDDFRKQTKRWLPSESMKATKRKPSPGDETSPRRSPKALPEASPDKTLEGSDKDSTYEDIRDAIQKAEDLYCDIKDIRDELNILKSAAQHQQTVEEGLTRGSPDVDLAAAYIVKDLREMDNSAERINTTLSLLQSENANLQATLSLKQSKLSNHLANLARQQGKTLMAFTVVTILFLPLSFLSSLFALDVASFQQAPGWAFAVIFAVSFAFSIITALVAERWEKISPHLKKLGRFFGSVIPLKAGLQLLKMLFANDEKSKQTKPKIRKEESVDKAEDKGPVDKCSTGDTDSHHRPFFVRLRSQPRKKELDPEVLVGEGITVRG